jgi:hypothetical protein
MNATVTLVLCLTGQGEPPDCCTARILDDAKPCSQVEPTSTRFYRQAQTEVGTQAARLQV